MKTKQVLIPGLKRHVVFQDRHAMKAGHPVERFKLFDGHTRQALPPAKLPIDWTRDNQIYFPIDQNDVLGDCFVAAMEHQDNLWTGNNGVQSVFNDVDTKAWYLALSGGDNGLSEEMVIPAWKQGLPGIRAACILDALDVDATNAPLVQSAMSLFGGVQFQLAVPDAWVNHFKTGYIWDAGRGITADMNNGHAILWAGVMVNGNYVLETWGTWGIITPAGVRICDPSAFVAFSLRWFNAAGYAPNGLHISALAPLWVQAGGSVVVLQAVSQFPPAVGPAPTPVPVPVPPGPSPGQAVLTLPTSLPPGTYTLTKQ